MLNGINGSKTTIGAGIVAVGEGVKILDVIPPEFEIAGIPVVAAIQVIGAIFALFGLGHKAVKGGK